MIRYSSTQSVFALALIGALAFIYLPHKTPSRDFAADSSRTPRPPSPTMGFRDLFGARDTGGKMASLWYERSFKDGADNSHVMFFATEKADQPGCQACAVDIAAITYKQVSGRWQVTLKQEKFGESVLGGAGIAHSGLKIVDVANSRL